MQPFLVLFVMLLGAPGRAKRAPAAALAPDRHPLRVMTYNVNWSNPDPKTSIDAIATADPDVVMLQEVTAAWRDALTSRLATRYPHRAYRVMRASSGLAVLSKHAIASEELLVHTGLRPAQRAVVATPLGAIQLLNVHLRPAIDRGSWVRGYFTTPPVRRREIEAHWARIEDLPTIAAGDFNEAASGSAVGFVRARGLARIVPRGPTTWRYEASAGGRKLEVLKLDIDHVLVGPELAVGDAEVLDAGTSDHRPVVVTIGCR